MNRLPKNLMPSGIIVLALLMLTVFLASCGTDDPVAPVETNHAPTAPVINTGAGAPADAASNVALGAQLHWTCSDPDDDPLTYTVRFGTAAAPPAVAQDQSASSYTPTDLVNDTTYFWQIVAADDGAKSTSSPVWSFTTVVATSETISTPATPSGPVSATTAEVPSYSTTGAISSAGHDVEYRFDWGDGTMSDWVTIGTRTHRWDAAGTYEVAAQARCAVDTAVETAWSAILTVTVTAVSETVSVPNKPTGQISGEPGASLVYAVTGAGSSEGHAIEYRFDFGDGTQSDWTVAGTTSHTWAAAGNYNVTAQARCAVDTAIESVWSAALAVTVTVPATESVSVPVKPSGATEGAIGESLAYTTSGAVSTEGHPVEYRIDWGDGAFSDWGVSGSAEHAWASSGYYQLRAQARCQDHPAVESIWSPIRQVAIDIPETVSQPTTPTGLAILDIGESAYYKTRQAYSTLGHFVEYRCDWGDGTMSDWLSVIQISHAWDAAGTYPVTAQARCIEHPDIESNWSYAFEVTVLDDETVSAPDAPDGPAAITTLENPQYTFFAGATSTRDHTLEYRIDWGDGEVRGWGTSAYQYHQWDTAGTYELVAQARCQDHPTVESDWSVATTVVVSVPAEVVGDAYIGSRPSVGGIDELLEFSISSGYSNLDHPTELQIDWGDGTFSDWGPRVGLHYIRSHAWAAEGTYQITARARCIEHPAIMSDWVTPASLEIIATETVSVPTLSPSGEVTYDLGQYVSITARWSESNLDHSVEYQFEVNGTLTEWGSYARSLVTDVPIDYVVKVHARCVDHPDIVSDWTETVLIHIVDLENLSKPTVAGPATGTTGVPVPFTVSGAESSHGHILEYQLYWGTDYNRRDNPQGWTTPDNLTITWAEAATYNLFVFVKARCVEHPDVESVFSSYHVIVISD